MLHRVNGVRALLVLCIFNILGQCHLQSIPSSLLSRVPTEYDGCEDLQNIIPMLKSMPAHQAFALLTLPLASASNPVKIQSIRQELLDAVTRGSLPISSILQDLGNVKNHNRYDLLITTLMAINEYTNTNCAIKDDISKVIFYLLKQKYLYKIDASAVDRFGTCGIQCSPSNLQDNGNINVGPTQQTPLSSLSLKQAKDLPQAAAYSNQPNRQRNTLRPAIGQEAPEIKYPALKHSNTPNDHLVRPGQRYQPKEAPTNEQSKQGIRLSKSFSLQIPSRDQQNPNINPNDGIVHLNKVSPEVLKPSTLKAEAPFPTALPKARPTVLVMQTDNPKQYVSDSNGPGRPIQLLNPVKQGGQNSDLHRPGSPTQITLSPVYPTSTFTQGPKSPGTSQHPNNPNMPTSTLNPNGRSANIPYSNPLQPHGLGPNGRPSSQNSNPLFPYSLTLSKLYPNQKIQGNPFYTNLMNSMIQNGFSRNGLYPGHLGLGSPLTINKNGFGRNGLYPGYPGLGSPVMMNKNGFGPNGLYPGLSSPISIGKNGFAPYGFYPNRPFPTYPMAPMKPNSFPRKDQKNDSCTCQKHLFEILLNKIIDLEKRTEQLYESNSLIKSALNQPPRPASPLLKTGGIPNGINTTPGTRLGFAPPTRTPIVVKKPTFDVDELLKVLPQPKYPKEQDMYNKFKNLLHSRQVQGLVNSMDLSKYHDNSELLDVILTTISKDVTITTETQEIISFFIPFKEAKKSDFNFGNLINVVPKPLTSKEVLYFNNFKNYLTSKDVYNDINAEALKAVPDMGYKLLNVLQQLNNNPKIPPNLREIVNYYIPIISGRLNKIRFDDLVSLLPQPKMEPDFVKYNIMKRFLQGNEIYVVMKDINVSSASSRMEVLKMILRQLISNPLAKDLKLIAIYYRNILAFLKFGFNYYDLLHLILPTADNLPHLNAIETYMYTTEFENIISQLQNLATLSDFNKLSGTLSAVEKNASDKTQVVNSAKYLLLKLNQARFFQSMDQIPPLLPRPKNQDEHQKLMAITRFLHTEDAYQLLHNLDTTLFPDNKFLVEYILRTITDATVSAEVKEAAKYYLSLSEKLETLEFVTKKEIKKNFQLHEIFSDALDLQKLTIPQKNALRKFFKYLAVVKPQAMSNFDSWDEAKTRWQFVKLMFKYFLEKAPTPVEIQASIKILDPLVKEDGRAALPP